MNKIETLTGSRELLHISIEKLLGKLRGAGIHLYAPNCADNSKIVTLDISYFDGLTKITKK